MTGGPAADRANGPEVSDSGAANGVGSASEAAAVAVGGTSSFSWLDPHPIFVIVLVGEEETPFGVQKDFLCAKSDFYRNYFDANAEAAIEHIVKLPDTSVEIFAYAQNFLFTGRVFSTPATMPSYEVLIGVWKLGHRLGIEGLCDATLDAMAECRRLTAHIPATPLLVQVWKDTPEGSSIRKLLLSWAAEYMRSSDSRAEFARSLPQEVLSELVVTMSSLDAAPQGAASGGAAAGASSGGTTALPSSQQQQQQQHHEGQQRRNVHYLDDDDENDHSGGGVNGRTAAKKQRHSDVLPNGTASQVPKSTANRTVTVRTSLPGAKPPGKRRSAANLASQQFTTEQKLSFCANLLGRMLSGPGFWTRLVGPFKEPVDPVQDGVPDYPDKVGRPMDLGTMRDKMANGEYTDETQFLDDMHLIFNNCYTYWTKKDPMWQACEKLQKSFEEGYAQMNRWIAKMEGDEGS